MHIAIGLAVAFLCFLAILFANKIDAHPKVDGGEWRVKASKSGKTWEAYRWTGRFGEQQRKNRFKSREAAEAWVRAVGRNLPK